MPLARLIRNQHITFTRRRASTTRHLTGLAFAIFYTEVCCRILGPPFIADRPGG